MVKTILAPFQSKAFLLLLAANVFFQFEATENFFNSLFSQNSESVFAETSAEQHLCGSTAFWSLAKSPASPLLSVPTSQCASSTSLAKYKTSASLNSIFLLVSKLTISAAFAEAVSKKPVKQGRRYSGLSPPDVL